MDEREKLQERYDDAAFALMMDECAEADGEAFLAEFRAAAEAGDLPEIPADMDRRFRDTIKREFAARERKVRFRQFKRAAARVAVAVFAVIGILSTLVMSVDAWRVQLIDKLQTFNRFSAIVNSDIVETRPSEGDPFLAFVPHGYESTFFSADEDIVSALYKDEAGNRLNVDISPIYDEYRFDTEDSTVTQIDLAGFEAIFASKINIENQYVVVWIDNEKGHTYNVSTKGLNEEDFWEFAETIAQMRISPSDINCPSLNAEPIVDFVDPFSQGADYFLKYLPTDYISTIFTVDELSFSAHYEDGEGHGIEIEICHIRDEYRFDTQNSTIEQSELAGFDATFVTGNNIENHYSVMWTDKEAGFRYIVLSEGLSEDEFLKFVEIVAMSYIHPIDFMPPFD